MCFFTSGVYKNYNLWSCQKVCDTLVYLLDKSFIRFGTKLYRQTIGIPMGTSCVPDFYGDLVYRIRKIVGKSNFSEQFRKERIGYSLEFMRQTACLVIDPIISDGYASLFNCMTAVRASDSMTDSSKKF